MDLSLVEPDHKNVIHILVLQLLHLAKTIGGLGQPFQLDQLFDARTGVRGVEQCTAAFRLFSGRSCTSPQCYGYNSTPSGSSLVFFPLAILS